MMECDCVSDMESELNPTNRGSLAMIHEARVAAAARFVTPWWYHPVLGLILGCYLVVWTLSGTLLRLVATIVLLGCVSVLVQVYKRITGVWVNGMKAGRASRWAYLLGGVYVLALVGSILVHSTTDMVWPVIASGVVLLLGTVLIGRQFDEAFRAQLREGG